MASINRFHSSHPHAATGRIIPGTKTHNDRSQSTIGVRFFDLSIPIRVHSWPSVFRPVGIQSSSFFHGVLLVRILAFSAQKRTTTGPSPGSEFVFSTPIRVYSRPSVFRPVGIQSSSFLHGVLLVRILAFSAQKRTTTGLSPRSEFVFSIPIRVHSRPSVFCPSPPDPSRASSFFRPTPREPCRPEMPSRMTRRLH